MQSLAPRNGASSSAIEWAAKNEAGGKITVRSFNCVFEELSCYLEFKRSLNVRSGRKEKRFTERVCHAVRPAGKDGAPQTNARILQLHFSTPEHRNCYDVFIALPSYRLFGELVLTISWINNRGSVLTTDLGGMQIAIYMELNNEVFNRLLLSNIDFRVIQLQQQRAIRPATQTPDTTVMGGAALTLPPVSRVHAAATTAAATSNKTPYAAAVTRAQATAMMLPNE